MKQWHYSEFDKAQGPVPQNELSQMFESGRLPPHTQVWTEGQSDWQAASTIEGLIPLSTLETLIDEAPDTMRKVANDDFEASGEQTRPWIRYWARMIDFITFCICSGFVIALINEAILDQINDTIFGIIMLLAYILVEPLMLMSWGTTPGKFLFNIRLRNADGSKLSYLEGATRSIKVAFAGQGAGVPLISLITHIMAYNRLENQGITSWDESGNHTVAHREIGIWRILIVILSFIGFITLIMWDVQSELPTY